MEYILICNELLNCFRNGLIGVVLLCLTGHTQTYYLYIYLCIVALK